MSDLIGENKLLKDLVNALTKENDSRNQERAVLNSELDRLSFENSELEKRLRNIGNLQNENHRLKIKVQELEGRTVVKKEVISTQTNKKREIQLENRILELERKEKNQIQQHKNEVELLKKEWSNKVNEGNIRIKQLQGKVSTSSANLRSLQNSKSDFFKLELRVKEKDDKIRSLEQSKNQVLNKMKNLEFEISEKQFALGKAREREREIGKFDQTLAKKDEEIKRLNKTIAILNDSLLKSQQRVKEKNLEREQLQVETRKMKELMNEDTHIHREEINRLQMKYQLEIKRLNATIEKLQYERQIENQNIENEEMMQMQKENQYLNRLISTLKEDNKNIKQTAHYQKERLQELQLHHNSSLSHSENEQKDLKEMVLQLKKQLTQMKSSYVKMHSENEKMNSAINQHISHKESVPFQSSPRSQVYQSEMNMGEHFMGRRSKLTPSRMSENCQWGMKSEKYDGGKREMPSNFTLGKNQAVGRQKSENQSVNREKWQALQRKINMLREENDELKKTLFD